MNEKNESLRQMTRRHFFRQTGFGIGALALSSMLDQNLFAQSEQHGPAVNSTGPMASKIPHFAPKARNVIYLFMAGAPSQLDLFDHKPKLRRTTASRSPRASSRASASPSSRARRACSARRSSSNSTGESGAEISDAAAAPREHRRRDRHHPLDDNDAVQSRAGADLHEHGPPDHRAAQPGVVAQLRPRQREQRPARASSCCISGRRTTPTAASRAGAAASCRPCTRASSSAPRASRCSSSRNPDGVERRQRGASRSTSCARPEPMRSSPKSATPRSTTRIAAYELAYRMQTSVPELTDIAKEPPRVHEMYGTEAGQGLVRQQLPAGAPAGRARRALRAALSPRLGHARRRRPAPTSSVRCHGSAARSTAPCGALLTDLKQRGLLDTRSSSGAASSAARR